MERMIAKAILQERGNIQAEISSLIQNAIDNHIPSQVDALVRSYMSGHILHVHPVQSQTTLVPEQQYQLYLSMKADPQLQQQDIAIWLAFEMKFKRLQSQSSGKSMKRNEVPSTLAPAYLLINQDLLYLKKGSSGPKKIVLSLHKFPAIIFNDDDIEERTSRWVNKCVKKFNPYAQYGVEHWKNPHAKIFYIKKQKDPGKPKEEVYSNSKIIQFIKTYWKLGHEHKFITKIVARRANECTVSITESDYKNLNKNDIEDMYLLIMQGT
ncbi:hypothetical protein Tco_0103992 [Tanacetum coccineum]